MFVGLEEWEQADFVIAATAFWNTVWQKKRYVV